MVEVKFCGMTRRDDVRAAVQLGAEYVGVIFTSSPRRVTPAQAATILQPTAGTAVRRVGVFGNEPVEGVLSVTREVALDVVQLHAWWDDSDVDALRAGYPGDVWRVIRVGPEGLSDTDRMLFRPGAGVVLDAFSTAALGAPVPRLTGVAYRVVCLRCVAGLA